MKAFDANPDLRWLFCMTHPDDEISICAWISRLAKAGVEVHLCWTHSTPIREAEARETAKLLRVPSERLTFLSAKDGCVCDELEELLPTFKALVERIKPDRIACGAFEQGHLDHDSTNWLINQTFTGPVFEIPFYHAYTRRMQTVNRFADETGQEMIELTEGEQRLKVSVAKAYRSQNIWSVLWWYEIWQMVCFRPAGLRKRELMRLQTVKDFTQPNLPEPLKSEVAASAPWKRWRAAVERLNMPP